MGSMGAKNPRYLPFPLGEMDPHLIYLSLDQHHLPTQTASRPNQLFCHSTPSGQTDIPTDGLGDRSVQRPVIHSILPVQFMCLTVICIASLQVLFGVPLGLEPPLHTPYISSPNSCLLFATHAHTITTCFAVVLRLCH